MIRLTIPSIEDDDLQAVVDVLKSGYLIQGPNVEEFEHRVSNYVGAQYSVAVSNCTTALHLALLSLDVRVGDMVVVTTYSWPATANVIELCGAQPVFVDIDPNTFNINPQKLEQTLEALMSNPETARRVKAVLPVHTFGQMADMPAICATAAKYNLPVIEDAACALGASIAGKQAGTWGVMGCFSFHPRKAITTGEGGIIATNDPSLANRLKALRNHGVDPENTEKIDFILPGYNYRLTEFQAALGVTQMNKLDRIISARRERARIYDKLLADTPFQAPYVPAENKPVYQSYITLLPLGTNRQAIISYLLENGIQSTIGTYHMPMTTYFRTRYGYQVGDFPSTDDVFARALTLPLHEFLTEEEQQKVVAQLYGALNGNCP